MSGRLWKQRKEYIVKLYKLTDRNDQTMNHTQWGPGITHTAQGSSKNLCNKNWIHAYSDPYVALLMNPAHAGFKRPHLWEAEGTIGLAEAGKVGCVSLQTIRRLKKPRITLTMCRKFSLLCALEVYPLWKKYDTDKIWITWAKSPKKARAAAAAAAAAAWTAWAWAAAWAEAAAAAEAAAWAAAEEEAAAAWAAEAVAGVAHITPDKLIELAHKACLGK